jgi:hypothetical protein
MFVIIKYMESKDGVVVPVILLDALGEVWEFNSKESAQEMVNIFNTNSDSGHKYEVKKI